MAPKRDIVFPNDSVEATTPVFYRRRKIGKLDIGQTDPWRIFMALRSGLLMESTWALDVLNILLFDDSSVAYFGLANLPGLLNLLLDYFQCSLSDMFDSETSKKLGYGWASLQTGIKNEKDEDEGDIKREPHTNGLADCDDVDLGIVTDVPNNDDRVLILSSAANYTMASRKGMPVKITPADDDVFVLSHRKSWDRSADLQYQHSTSVGCDPWTIGHTQPEPHEYIMDSFKAEFANIPFSKELKVENAKKYKMYRQNKCATARTASATNNNSDINRNCISDSSRQLEQSNSGSHRTMKSSANNTSSSANNSGKANHQLFFNSNGSTTAENVAYPATTASTATTIGANSNFVVKKENLSSLNDQVSV
jgi:AT-rich interactive domain-containing protein 1